MARMRRSSEQTLEYKIEQAEAKVAKTREAHEKAVDELKKLYDIRKAYQRDELLKAMKTAVVLMKRSWHLLPRERHQRMSKTGLNKPVNRQDK